MANTKPKKSVKKPAAKSDAPKETKETKEAKDVKASKAVKSAPAAVAAATCDKPMKGFFARKCDANENILTIFKTPKIWGALIGEVVGTMLITMLLMLLGITQPLYIVIAMVGVYIAVVGISGAHLNPLVTVGMMATRRVSAIRGVLYMLAQLLGAWIALIVVNAFRLGSETTTELPMMAEVTGETFWAVALIELLGAIIIAFVFARALKYAKKQPLAFGVAVTSAITLASIVAIFISQGYFTLSDNFMFNPAVSLMYQILPTAADNFGELASMAGMALAAYVIIPMIGGVIGFYIADSATRLSAGGYFCAIDSCCCEKKEEK